jgi:putative membrane protein
MRGIQFIFRDWKMMWSHKHGRIALVFLLIVPLIYAGLFLAGYWNPYGRLDQLPVAVVNLDQGAMMDHKSIHAGNDFVEKLKENKDLNFQFVSQSEADQGLKEGKYYMVVTIPNDFSQKVSTLMDDHPQPAQLLYKINPGKNYVASQISTTAMEEMKTKIANSITKSYAEGVFSKFQELAKGLGDAGEGAGKLNQGATDAKNGMVQLSDGIHRLDDGVEQLKTGSNQLSIGQQKLGQGIQGIQNGTLALYNGLEQLSKGHQTLETGMEQLTQGVKAWSDGNEKLVQGQARVNDTANILKKQLEQYIQNHPEAQQDPSFQQIVAISSGLANATNELNSGQTQLAQGAKRLADGQAKIEEGMKQFGEKMNQVTIGAKQLSDGTIQFANGFHQWNQGFSSLDAGIYKLANGGKQLDNGANQLTDGLIQLTDGTNELSTKLQEAAKKTSNVHNNDALTSMFSEPVKLVKSNISDVPNYGTGIAPYFLSLAFYVGGIMASNILPLGRRQDLKVSGTVHFINKLGLVYSIGLIQALIVDMVLLFGFKLHVASTLMFILSSVIISFTFMTFILMLVTVFGIVGKFAAVTLLVLQLATCGGTFPSDLNLPLLRDIGQILPMAHSLHGLQDVISLGDWQHLQSEIWMLLGYLIVAAGIAWITSHIQHSKTPAEHTH